MAPDLRRDFRKLMAGGRPLDPRAPWWVNWLLQVAIFLGGVWLLATAADWLLVSAFGREPMAVCALAGVLATVVPLSRDLFGAVALLLVAGAMIAFAFGARGAAAGALLGGVLLSLVPELAGDLSLVSSCVR